MMFVLSLIHLQPFQTKAEKCRVDFTSIVYEPGLGGKLIECTLTTFPTLIQNSNSAK